MPPVTGALFNFNAMGGRSHGGADGSPQACFLCLEIEALSGHKFCFESDSKEAIGWVKDADFRNLLMVEFGVSFEFGCLGSVFGFAGFCVVSVVCGVFVVFSLLCFLAVVIAFLFGFVACVGLVACLPVPLLNQESVFPAKEISMESAKESRSLKLQAVNVGENHGIPENKRRVTVEDTDPSEDNRKFVDEVCIGPSSPQETVKGAAISRVHNEGVKLRKEKDRPLGRLMGLAKEISAMVVDNGPTTIRPQENVVYGPNGAGAKQSKKGNPIVPKRGKWKRWARDGAQWDNRVAADSQLGKRTQLECDDHVGKKVKVVTTDEVSGVCNFQWRDLFFGLTVTHLEYWKSDHIPLLVEVNLHAQLPAMVDTCRDRRFLFEECWVENVECTNLVKRVWARDTGGSDMDTVLDNAECGRASSYLWKSFICGLELLKAGSCWRIGDGASVSIYEDHWLPRPFTFKPFSSACLDHGSLVKDLLLPDGGWNVALIQESFWPEDANMILSLPRPQMAVPDSLMWHYDKLGPYSVMSGYHFGCNLSSSASSSRFSSSKSWWKFLWHMHIPVKVKNRRPRTQVNGKNLEDGNADTAMNNA
ncbi:hypothetical protein EZV62_026063 [Acer yangbiense]|uniref:RNase H type-1 domain-containing protein n=1 Tax=Acer yangbiense TaxID=1000413 RepID=A0A5C7GQI7_9ROSI|nr:hypothetical protein EZV62_026063 [Acer yangbiense]